ncbi:retrovirus-related Pol polyprotein from type-1 retrotransposable element R2 [Caerostris darwini]|uniref:Retrovirus-related Pol polyprotein from type-1 retrotransposable element R2 n=1 Tax=Caerostris darwini TaxID=1538125 RepID=A0AAV4TDA9_9ARAC|nr:retrovirus-related Pol polyprotein from type-1 retrotransposable element R2 [Caerostris darwini]
MQKLRRCHKFPALTLPPSRRRKRARRTRPAASPVSDEDNMHISEVSQLLAPPIEDVPLVEVASQNLDHADEPLFHFVQIFQDILSSPVSLLRTALHCYLKRIRSWLRKRPTLSFPKNQCHHPLLLPGPLTSMTLSSVSGSTKRNRRRAIREIQKVSGERSCESTAPAVLTQLFNCCVQLKFFPEEWKKSTILLPKSGDPSSLANWRPIALGNTASKLFMKCLTARLQNWCQKYDALSPCQKGFTPFDGVLEHNFVLQRRIEKARSSRSHLCIAFLDVSNAFGSLPHSAIRDCLAALGVGDTFLRLVMDAYSSCSTTILTNDTDPVMINCEVKQGCPLSGLLF